MRINKHECAPENAQRFLTWLSTRGGIAIWESVNMSNMGASWSSPALTDGEPTPKPTWEAANKPARVITSADDVEVITRKEVKRFRVGIRTGAQGFMLKVTDGGTRNIDKALKKAGEGAAYHFDYETQEAVITVPGETLTLTEWAQRQTQQDATAVG